MNFREGNHYIFCGCFVCMLFLQKDYLIVNLFLTIKNAYEMLPMRIFQKNVQTRDLFLLEPEVVT